jgi:hypothetical protein
MYRLFSIQLLTICIFYYFPTLLACLHIFEVIDLQNFCTANICIMIWHSPIQCIITLIGYPEIRRNIMLIRFVKWSKITKNSLTQHLLHTVILSDDHFGIGANPIF